IQKIRIDRSRHHHRAISFPPRQNQSMGGLHRTPDPCVVFEYWHVRTIKLSPADHSVLTVRRLRPRLPAIFGATDENGTMMPVRSHQIEILIMHEQRAPECTRYRADLLPRFSFVFRCKNPCDSLGPFGAARSEKIMRSDVVSIRKNYQAWRSDVLLRCSWLVTDDRAGNFLSFDLNQRKTDRKQ